MGWDNWFEGEVGCSPAHLEQIEKLAHTSLIIGEPENLKPEVIALNRQRLLRVSGACKNLFVFNLPASKWLYCRTVWSTILSCAGNTGLEY